MFLVSVFVMCLAMHFEMSTTNYKDASNAEEWFKTLFFELFIPYLHCRFIFSGECAADRLLNGKHYNNAMRALKYSYNAFMQTKLRHMKVWLLENGHPSFDKITSTTQFHQFVNDVCYYYLFAFISLLTYFFLRLSTYF